MVEQAAVQDESQATGDIRRVAVDRQVPTRWEKELTDQEVDFYHSEYAATELYTASTSISANNSSKFSKTNIGIIFALSTVKRTTIFESIQENVVSFQKHSNNP